jgi:hypothetical protein
MKKHAVSFISSVTAAIGFALIILTVVTWSRVALADDPTPTPNPVPVQNYCYCDNEDFDCGSGDGDCGTAEVCDACYCDPEKNFACTNGQ